MNDVGSPPAPAQDESQAARRSRTGWGAGVQLTQGGHRRAESGLSEVIHVGCGVWGLR